MFGEGRCPLRPVLSQTTSKTSIGTTVYIQGTELKTCHLLMSGLSRERDQAHSLSKEPMYKVFLGLAQRRNPLMSQPLAKSTCCFGTVSGAMFLDILLRELPQALCSLARWAVILVLLRTLFLWRHGFTSTKWNCACAQHFHNVTASPCPQVRSAPAPGAAGITGCSRSSFKLGGCAYGFASGRRFIERSGPGGASESTEGVRGEVWAALGDQSRKEWYRVFSVWQMLIFLKVFISNQKI